jgi:hypothetical protein
MNTQTLFTLASLAEGVELCTKVEQAYISKFKRSPSIELFVASTFIGARNAKKKEVVELTVKWLPENDAKAKQDIEWVKQFLS